MILRMTLSNLAFLTMCCFIFSNIAFAQGGSDTQVSIKDSRGITIEYKGPCQTEINTKIEKHSAEALTASYNDVTEVAQIFSKDFANKCSDVKTIHFVVQWHIDDLACRGGCIITSRRSAGWVAAQRKRERLLAEAEKRDAPFRAEREKQEKIKVEQERIKEDIQRRAPQTYADIMQLLKNDDLEPLVHNVNLFSNFYIQYTNAYAQYCVSHMVDPITEKSTLVSRKVDGFGTEISREETDGGTVTLPRAYYNAYKHQENIFRTSEIQRQLLMIGESFNRGKSFVPDGIANIKNRVAEQKKLEGNVQQGCTSSEVTKVYNNMQKFALRKEKLKPPSTER